MNLGNSLDLLLIDVISKGQVGDILKYLNYIPIERMSIEKSNSVLNRYLGVAAENRQFDSARYIMEFFNRKSYLPMSETRISKDEILLKVEKGVGNIDKKSDFSEKSAEEFAENFQNKFNLQVEEKIKVKNETSTNSEFRPNRLPLFTSMFLYQIFEDNILQFLAEVYLDQYTFINHLEGLVYYDSSPLVPNAINRMRNIYGDLSYNDYLTILELAEEQENSMIEEIISLLIQRLSPTADKPNWIRNFSNLPNNQIPTEHQLLLPEERASFTVESIENMVNLLTAGLYDQNIEITKIDEAQDSLRRLLAISSNEQKLELLKPILTTKMREELSDDKNIFRILGPVNPQFGADLDGDHICQRYGGCRMFTCVHFEYDNPDDDEFPFNDDDDKTTDWFTGACDYCLKRIFNRYYAIRRPLTLGGWVGCYCSIKCLRENIWDKYSDDLLGVAISDQMIKQLNDIGIQDRIVVSPDPGTDFIDPIDPQEENFDQMTDTLVERELSLNTPV